MMITQELLDSYKKYAGDIDAWSRYNASDKNGYSDWFLISSLLQDLKLAKGNLASEEYITTLEIRIKANCDNALTVERLIAMTAIANSKNSEKKPWWKLF